MNATAWSQYHTQKEQLRQIIWTKLQTLNTVHSPCHGHIPYFIGAELAAQQLAQLDIWRNAQVIKCNPDKAQAPVRAQALAAGKTLYMAVPRLVEDYCFIELRREWLPENLEKPWDFMAIAQKETLLKLARPVKFQAMCPIDLAVVGSVAATPAGGRTGKGAGFADLELAMLQNFNLISPNTQIATTIHDAQIVTPEELPVESHDWSLDWLCTPTRAIATQHQHPRPQGLDWQKIQDQQWRSIPILRELQQNFKDKSAFNGHSK
jgi:5-formyltetrahydrofolate cyclo-ligase